MCTDETKQEIVFLIALGNGDEILSKFDISSRMALEVETLGWPQYLVRNPRSIGKLILRAAEFEHIKKCSTTGWKISNEGKKRRDYITNRYVPASEKQAVTELVSQVA